MAFALGPKAEAAGHRLAAFETIGSTSEEALNRARAGDLCHLWVVSAEQSAGRGRRGRAWQTPRGNLAASLLLVGSNPPAHSARLGFVAGVALASAIRGFDPVVSQANRSRAKPSPPCGERVADPQDRLGEGGIPAPSRFAATPSPQGGGGDGLRLKWPNDVLLDGAKVAGILLQAASLPGGRNAVAIGIGVNVRHAPEGVPYAATSLAAGGIDVSAEALFTALAEAWVDADAVWRGGAGFAEIRERWLGCAAGIGAPIAIRQGEAVLTGAFETIDAEGRLVVRSADGARRAVNAGDVHFGNVATVGA